MYTRDTLVLLKHFLDSGLSKTAIADQLGISRRLVHHLIATGQLDRDLGEDASPRTRAVTGVAKLATVTPWIETRLAVFPALSAGTPPPVGRRSRGRRSGRPLNLP